MKPITDELFKRLNVVEYTCRIKSPQSVISNLSGANERKRNMPTYDMFGMRFFVIQKSLFDAFLVCESIGNENIDKPFIKDIAVSHGVKSKTSWTDFKFVIQFAVSGFPVVEIQIVPIESFISDESVKGHDTLKEELQVDKIKLCM